MDCFGDVAVITSFLRAVDKKIEAAIVEFDEAVCYEVA